jgi:arylsulfatase A-like enzyme
VLPRYTADQPDIIVVMIESLRADEIGGADGTRTSATPNLDALAQHSVVFPTFVSNGFPSAPSVLAFHCSAWPHRRKEIITDFADRRFDSIPARLRDFGYETTYIGADPHFDHQDRWLPAWYSTVIDLVANGETPTDHNILTRSIEEIRRHDRAAEGRPLFEFISTYSTHYPFRLPDDAGELAVAVTEPLEPRYRQVLKYTDREVGALLSFLAARERRDRTITIVLGDHGFYMDLRRTSGLPENDNIWTAAIVAGPERFIGQPRRIVAPASHVDLLPTLLAFVGDRRPSASLGGDLFGPPRNGTRTSLAVRPGGLRLDRDGASVLVDARMPTLAINRVAFPGLMPAHPAAPPIDAAALTDVVADWSYLIERNRVWSPSFLASPSTRR